MGTVSTASDQAVVSLQARRARDAQGALCGAEVWPGAHSAGPSCVQLGPGGAMCLHDEWLVGF